MYLEKSRINRELVYLKIVWQSIDDRFHSVLPVLRYRNIFTWNVSSCALLMKSVHGSSGGMYEQIQVRFNLSCVHFDKKIGSKCSIKKKKEKKKKLHHYCETI